MRISEINIYPIKSLRGIELNEAKIEDRGLQYDRRWLLVDEKNKFLTQREFPQLATFDLVISEAELKVSYAGNGMNFPIAANSGETRNVKIWSSSVKADFYGEEVNRWFSEKLDSPCRLVAMTEKSVRKVSPFYAVRKFEDTVSFADAYPFLLIGENSLKELNEKLEKPVPMNRFRPNFVVSDSDAFAEDSWKKIKIGDTIFHVVKSCARCVMTTIEQATGEKTGAEPLKTLAVFRKKRGKVLFGRYLIAENAGGTVKIGDRVEVLEYKKSARAS